MSRIGTFKNYVDFEHNLEIYRGNFWNISVGGIEGWGVRMSESIVYYV
jgi:hypothetical protein